MAMVEGDTFVVPIEGKDETKKSFAAIEASLRKVAEQFQKAQKVIEAAFTAVGASSDALNQVRSSFEKAESSGAGLIKTTREVGDTMRATSQIVETTENSFIGITAASVGFAIALDRGLIRTVRDLSLVFKFLSTDLVAISGAVRNSLTPSFLNFVKGATLAAPALVLFGKSVQDSESALVRFTGTLSIVGGILLGAFSLAVIGAVKILSDFARVVGEKLIEAFTAFEKEASKAARTTAQFVFAITGFNRELGEDAVGSLEMWNEMVAQTEKTTTFTTQAIQKSVKLLVAEGSRLGLTVEDTTGLLQRASDVAAVTGNDLTDVTQALISALAGQSQAALSLGIDIREATLGHSHLLEASGKTFEQLSQGQQTLLRLGEIFRQTTPIIGAAANDLNTVAGASEVLEKRYQQIRIELGNQTQFTVYYILVLEKLASAFLSLPKPIIQVVGSLGDFLGVALKVIGTLGVYALTIAGITTAYGLLNNIIASSIAIQTGLNSAFLFANRAIGAQIVEVTGLSAVWANIGALLRGGILIGLQSLGSILLAVGAAFAKALIVITPFLIKVAAIVAVVRAVYTAITEILPQLEGFQIILTIVTDAVNTVTKSFSTFFNLLSSDGINLFSRLLVIVQDVANIFVSGLAGAVTTATIAWLKFKQSVLDSSDEAEKTQKTINALMRDLDRLGNTIVKSGLQIVDVFEGKALAAVNEQTGKVKNAIDGIADRFKNMAKVAKASAEDIANALKQLINENRNLQLQIDNIGATQEQKIKNQLAFALQGITLKRQELTAQGALTKEIQAQLALQAKLVKLNASKELTELQKEQVKKAAEAIQQLSDKNRTFEIERLEANNQLVVAQGLKNQAALEAFDREIDKLKEQKLLGEDNLDLIEKTRKALIRRGEAELGKAGIEQKRQAEKNARASGTVEIFGPQQVETITAAFGQGAGEAAAGISGALAGFTTPIAAANMVADAVQGLIDAIPQLLDKIANIFNTLTDLPNKILAGLLKVGDALTNFFSNFIPNLARALPKILTELLVRIPRIIQEGFFQLLDQLPMIFDAIVEAIPQVITGMIENFGRFVALFIEFLIKDAPKIAKAFIKYALIDLPKAIVKGIVDGLALLGGIFSDLFKGVFPVKEIEDGVKKIGDKISRSTSQLFKVIDLDAEARGLDVADRIRTAITSASSKGASFFDRAWQKIKDWFDKVFGDLIERAWATVLAVLRGLGKIVKDAWETVLRVLNGLGTIVKDAWATVLKVLNGLGKIVQDAWETVLQVLNGLGKIVQDAWSTVLQVLNGLGGIVKNAWETVLRVLNGLGSIVSDAWKTVVNFFDLLFKGKVQEAFNGVIDFFSRTFSTIWNEVLVPVKDFFSKTFVTIWANVLSPIVDFFSRTFKTIWSDVLAPIVNFFTTTFKTIWADVLKPIVDFFVNAFKTAWAEVLKPIVDFFANAFKTVWNEVFTPIKDFFSNAFSGIWTEVTKPIKELFNKFAWPDFKFPALPAFKFPALPDFKFPALPDFKFPSLPAFAWPSLPKFEWPSIPKPSWLEGLFNAGGFVRGVTGKIGKGVQHAGAVVSDTAKDIGGSISSGAKSAGSSISKAYKRAFNDGGGVGTYGRVEVPKPRVINGILHAEDGAYAQGTDVLNAKLTPGEFVVNREATRNNLGLLSFINETRRPVSPVDATNNFSIVINAKTELTPDQIRREVVPTLERELRRKSQQGKFVIASAGVRD